MAQYAIIDSGIVTNVIDAPEGWPTGINITTLNPKPGIGWGFNGSVFTPPTVDPVPQPATTTPYMSHFGFLIRLTPQARLAIRDRTDKASASYDATLDDAMFLFNSAERIDVTLALTQQLVGYMAQTGLIDTGDMPTLLAPIDINSPHAKP